MNSGVTALMVQPLSKRAQLLLSFRSTSMCEWVWAQEGSFLRHLYAGEALPVAACWAATNF